MYSREYSKSTGAVNAFEDAYAKEEFLRRTGAVTNAPQNNLPSKEENSFATVQSEEIAVPTNNYAAKRTHGLAGLFSEMDSGDILLLLLIIFFLFDSDTENDIIIPILLGVLLLF